MILKSGYNLRYLFQCIRDLLQKGGKQQNTYHAAVWVPDNEASTCMLCKKIKFSVIERRVSLTTIDFFMEFKQIL